MAAVIRTQDIKQYGNDKCLIPLIEELKYLEEYGLEFTLPNRKIQVYFILGLLLGDNLGLNSLLSLNKSFSSNSFCRFCKIEKKQSHTTCTEKKELMRTVDNYNVDVASGDAKASGVIGECCFNVLPSFHVVDNMCVDVMHDIFEGICHYSLCHIILYFTETMQYLSLNTLNTRKQTFEYGPTEIGNLSTEIKMSHLKKKTFKNVC